jgi:hypothetical protein
VIDNPVSLFRAELHGAAARKASTYQRRRRSGVAIAVALAAVLIVGGAIAAQSRWFDSGNQIKFRYTAAGRAAAPDYPARGYARCMAGHGARRVSIGFRIDPRNADAESACRAYLDAFAATCRIPRQASDRVTPAMAAACVSEARQDAPAAR